MARFYGWTDDHIESLPAVVFYDYLESIEVIKSQEMLDGILLSEWAYIKADSQKKLKRDIHKVAYPKHLVAKKSYSNAELAALLGGKL